MIITRFKFVGLAVLLFAGVLPGFKASAATTTATVSATIISTEAGIVTAAELLAIADTGVLNLSIAGAGASGTSDGAAAEMTLTSTGVVGNTIIFSTTDTVSLASLLLAASGGSFSKNGNLSTGRRVNLFIVPDGNGKSSVYAIVTYD